MTQVPCKRFWEGPVGITLIPRKQHSGEYFWTFSFTRAFKRKDKTVWEYTDFFGQKHAAALGTVMSKAMQFMEQNVPDEFTAKSMTEQNSGSIIENDMQTQAVGGGLAAVSQPPSGTQLDVLASV